MNQCQGTFAVPVGTGYNVSLFLYDDCGYLLSAGTASGVNVTASASPVPVAIALNGVVAYYRHHREHDFPFVGDPSEAQTFTLNVAPLDADYYNYSTAPTSNTITPPAC